MHFAGLWRARPDRHAQQVLQITEIGDFRSAETTMYPAVYRKHSTFLETPVKSLVT
jgi:hypothetical protein